MLKKSLLCSAIALLPIIMPGTNAMANSADPDSDLYLKMVVGLTSFKSITCEGGPYDFYRTSFKGAANVAPNFGLGIGYQIKDNMRVDLTLDHVTNVQLQDKKRGIKARGVFNVVMLNGYVDLVKFEKAKVFFGAGAGYAHLSERITMLNKKDEDGNNKVFSFKSNKPAFSLSLGGSTDIYEGVKMDLTYSWREFGKSKSHKVDNKEIAAIGYKGHNMSVALRFDI